MQNDKFSDPVRSALTAGDPWPGYSDPSELMVEPVCHLRRPGPLLGALCGAAGPSSRTDCAGEPGRQGPCQWELKPWHGGLGAGAMTSASMVCFTAFARSVPQVSRHGTLAGSACCDWLRAHVSTPLP